MATMKDVAKKAEVSVATVSAVINKDSEVNVSDELTKRVEQAVRELNYRPNRIARALSSQTTHTLAYIVPSVSNNFFSQIAKYIEDMAFEKGYSVYLCNTESQIDRANLYTKNLLENRVDGIITTLTWEVIQSDLIETVISEDIPIVGLAGARVIGEIDTVTIDDLAGGRTATEHLLNQGHSKIGFIGVKESKTTEQRLSGFKKALNEAGIDVNEDYIELGDEFSRQEGFRLSKRLIQRNPELTAIFVYNDIMGTGVIDNLNELEIKIPADMAIIGFDDSVATYIRPNLSTMALPKHEMSRLAIDMLFKRMKDVTVELGHEKVLPKLIRREST
ncbi:substrate-binding domain-containing protein [Halanaerocella petrolearia]